MSFDDAELLREFVVESQEHLADVENQLLTLEAQGDNMDVALVNNVFRAVHSIKGAAGFLGLVTLQSLAHREEEVLNKLRTFELRPTSIVINTLLEATDELQTLLDCIDTSNEKDVSDHVRALERILSGDSHTIAVAMGSAEQSEGIGEGSGLAAESTIRVHVALLDKLMNCVSELVLARDQIVQLSSGQADNDLRNTSQRLNLVTTELQGIVMKTRMQPIGVVWSKFPRLVRDLAAFCGKQVRIELEGKETELDKTIIEAIKDPLIHMIRNTIDHGIEKPEVRLREGKSAEGCLTLRAYHEGGRVNIEICDDGAGLNVDRIRQKAVERGLLSTDQVARLSDREAVNLIFLPGFSTAETVSTISGRGVGMDVVKTNIEKIGGTVDLQSQPGFGTTIKIIIPLTLAIIPL